MAEANLVVLITGRGTQLINEFRKIGNAADKAGTQTKSGWSKASTAVKVAGASIAGAAVAVGVASVHMADKYEAAHARLETAIRNTGSSWEKQKDLIDSVTESATKFGYTRTDVEGALAGMTTGMGSSEKAAKAFQLAEDLAAAKGIDLAQAGLLVTKASEGQLRPLKQLGIDLPIAAAGAVKVKKAQDDLTKASEALKTVQDKISAGMLKGPAAADALASANQKVSDAQAKVNTTASAGSDILDALGKRLGGSASAQAATFEGKTKALKAQLDNVAISIGTALMPVLLKLATVLQSVVLWLQKHQTVAKALAIVIGTVLVAAITAMTIAWIADAAAMIAANAPFIAIGVAALGVAAAIVFLWTHWNQVWNWIAHHPAYAIVIGILTGPITIPIFALVAVAKFLYANWTTIWNGITAVTSTASRLIMDVLNPIIDVLHGIEAAAGAVSDALGHIHVPSFHLPHIPGFATGGVVPGPVGSPMVAVVHGGETVTPPGKLLADHQVRNQIVSRSSLQNSRPMAVGSDGSTVNININAPVYGVDHLHAVLAKAEQTFGRNNGRHTTTPTR